jgi:imidazoleglycerol phosphate synthase glutamine amidotransferase subunit HisH
VQEAERAVLPGVGAFADCMRGLPALPGWGDLAVGGQRLSVTPSGTGCSHY